VTAGRFGSVRLRRAEAADCAFVWNVNNEPSVRAQSIRSAPIPFEDHAAWFARKLVDANALLWVAEAPEAVGVVRCDKAAAGAEIGLALTPGARGRGLGAAMIAAACAAAAEAFGVLVVVALVRPENHASLRAFARAGFTPAGREAREGVTLERLEWRSPA